jgi:hypothetical protein
MELFANRQLTGLYALVLAVLIAVPCAWLPASSVAVSLNALSSLSSLATAVFLWLLLFGVRYQLHRAPFRYDGFVRTCAVRVQMVVVSLASFTCMSAALVVLSYLASATDRPLLDDYLAAADRAIGFDWISCAALFNESASAAAILKWAYNSLIYQVLAIHLLLALSSRPERLLEFATAFGLAGAITCAMQFMMPAAGAIAFYNPAPEIISSFGTSASAGHMQQLEQLRSLRDFVIESPVGIVTFPSFHAALGVIFIYYSRGFSYVSVLFLLLNAALIVSTIPVGGHHLVDIPMGVAVALASIMVVRMIASSNALARQMRASVARGVSPRFPSLE